MLGRTSSQSLEKDVAGSGSNGGKLIEFFCEFGSPTSCLAYTQLPRIAAAHRRENLVPPVPMVSNS